MSDFLPKGELVRAPKDVLRDDGSVAVPASTSGIVEGRDDLVPSIYWVLFRGAAEPIAVREGDVEPIPEQREAHALVSEALATLPGREACDLCRGPLVGGEKLVCRGCADADSLDAAVEADLKDGDPGQHGKPDYGVPDA